MEFEVSFYVFIVSDVVRGRIVGGIRMSHSDAVHYSAMSQGGTARVNWHASFAAYRRRLALLACCWSVLSRRRVSRARCPGSLHVHSSFFTYKSCSSTQHIFSAICLSVLPVPLYLLPSPIENAPRLAILFVRVL